MLWTIIWSACKGENASKNSFEGKNEIYFGDTVKAMSKNIMVVYQDQKLNYWFGSWKDGLYRYDGEKLLHFTTTNGLSHNRIDEIKEDKNGNLYFNTPEGIDKFDGKQFTRVPIIESLKSDWKLLPDDLWFKCSNKSGHVYRCDGKRAFVLNFPSNSLGDSVLSSNAKAFSYDVYCTYKDNQGNIWFGMAILGACRYDGKKVEWIWEKDVTELHNGPSNGVRSILQDKDGFFWFNSSFRYQVYGLNAVEKSFGKGTLPFIKRKGPGSLDANPNGNLTEYLSITKDTLENLWFATYQNGVFQYDGKNFTAHTVKENGKNISLFYIYADRVGKIWLATHENGVYVFNGKSFEQFVVK